MEISKTTARMLEHMGRPGFIVCDGKIVCVNADAAKHHIQLGTPVSELLMADMESYARFSEGSMQLTVTIDDLSYPAVVERLDGFDLFMLERENYAAQFRVLAMASSQLRVPLAELMNSIGEDNPTANRSLHQLHRAVSNMSDVMRYRLHRKPKLQMTELRSYMASVMESVIARSESMDVTITYTGLSKDLYCLIDEELLERAILNLISNAIKAHSHQIQVKLSLCRTVLTLTVSDDGQGIPSPLQAHLFEQFDREPGATESGYGLGLGMMLVQAAASAHKGTVLMERRNKGGMRITLTISVMKGESIIRAPMMKLDYLGGRDHILTELSDILPEDLY